MFIEKVLKYAAKYQESQNSSQVSLFGESSDVQIPEPVVPPCDDWGTMQKLSQERDVVGVFISGHPLDDFKNEIKYFCNASLAHLKNLEPLVNREVSFAGIVTGVEHRVSKNGKGWAMFTIEDYKDAYEFRIFGEEYLKQRHFLIVNSFVYVKLFVKQGWVNKETGKRSDPRIQFNSFEQLQDVMDKQSKKLSIQLNVADLTNDKVLALKETIRNNKGEKQLSFIVYEMEEKIKVTMISRTEKVNITNEFLDLLKKQNYKYKMN
jgi:DNA polymerase-3 subunit alpha